MPRRKATERPDGRPTDWGPRGPNDEPPNLRLARTKAGSADRFLHSPDDDEWFPAREYLRGDGVQYDLPVLENGQPDGALQRAGFWSPYAHRIARLSTNYVLIKE